MSEHEYTVRVTCDEDGTDETILIMQEQFQRILAVVDQPRRRCEAPSSRWVGYGKPCGTPLRNDGTCSEAHAHV